MTEELKPCPFCGGEAALIIPSELVEADCADIYVSCEECEAESQHVVVEMRDRTPDLWPCERRDAIAAWNTRLSHSAEKEALIEAEPFLAQLRRVNTERYEAWVGDGQDAGILFDAAELGGEVGELLNVVKKLEREERGWRGSRAAPDDFADECADVLICLDKLARRRGVNLEEATVRKFNATSDKVGLPQKLALRARSSLIEEERS